MLQLLRHLFHPYAGNNHRPKILHPSGLFSLTLIALLLHLGLHAVIRSESLGSVLAYNSSITLEEVLLSTNSERAKQQLPALNLELHLSNAASAKAWNMFKEQYWSHISPKGVLPWKFIRESGYVYVVAGENLARDFSNTPDMMRAWMNSPTHRSNIMNPRYKDIGIAVVDGKLLGIDTTLVVQMFGSPIVTPAQIPTSGAATSLPAPATPESDKELPSDTPTPHSVLSKTNEMITQTGISPLSISKAIFFTLVLLTIIVLTYDLAVSSKRNLVRITGKNLAHIILFSILLILILLYRGGSLL